MSKHVKNEETRLLRQREQVLRELEQIAAEPVRRFRAIEAALTVLRTPTDQRYMKYKRNIDAVEAVLEHEGRWMKRYEIADALQLGGYSMDPERGRQLVVYSIDKASNEKRRLIRQGELIGLPQWDTAGAISIAG